MASLNKAQLIGYLGDDPVVRYLPNGTPTVAISLATTDTWKNKETGEKHEHTEWHRIVFYRGLAEVVSKYLKKGSQAYVEGSLRHRKWTDKEGIDRYTTELEAKTMQMLDRAGSKTTNIENTEPLQDDAPPLPPIFDEEDEPFWR